MMVIAIVCVICCRAVLESVTVRAKVETPGAMGTPTNSPVLGCSAIPAGSVPEETAQVYAGVPPETDAVAL